MTLVQVVAAEVEAAGPGEAEGDMALTTMVEVTGLLVSVWKEKILIFRLNLT